MNPMAATFFLPLCGKNFSNSASIMVKLYCYKLTVKKKKVAFNFILTGEKGFNVAWRLKLDIKSCFYVAASLK